MNLANLRSEQRDGIVVAHLEGEVDMSNADQLKSALVRGMTNEVFGLVLDLSALEYIDSAGIHILLELREQLKNRGQALRLVVPAGSVVGRTLEIAGVGALVVRDETVETAVEAIGSRRPDGPGPGP
jgi:anti-sigma B factor antagonist